jgi:hypothetical protein
MDQSSGRRAMKTASSHPLVDASRRASDSSPAKGTETTHSRRVWLWGVGAGGLAAALLTAFPAWAGTYLTSAGMLVTEARRESDVLRKRLHDKELARLVHKMAEARLKIAASMQVPPEVAQAHPHLMLVLEYYERAAEAATKGQYKPWVVLTSRAREEEETYRAILKQLGWDLPRGD